MTEKPDYIKVIEEYFEKNKRPSLWNVMRFQLGFSVEQSNEIISAVEEWMPKEDPRPSYDTLQWDKCVGMMKEKLWEQTE